MCNVPEAQRSGPVGLQRQDRVRGSRVPRRYATGGARDMHPPPCHHPLSSGLSTEASQERGPRCRNPPQTHCQLVPPHLSDGETEAQRRKLPGWVRAELAAAPTNTQSLLGQPWSSYPTPRSASGWSERGLRHWGRLGVEALGALCAPRVMSGADAGAPLEGTEPGWTWIRAVRAQGGGRDATGTQLGLAIGEREQHAFHGPYDPPNPPAFAAAPCPAPLQIQGRAVREMQWSCSCQAPPQLSVLRASSASHGPSPPQPLDPAPGRPVHRLLLRFPSLSPSQSVEGPGLGWWPQGRGGGGT